MTMAASVYATPPPDLSAGEEAALSDASNSSQTNSSHGSALKASKRTLSSSFLSAATTPGSGTTTLLGVTSSSDSLPDLSKKRRKQSMPSRFAANGAAIEPAGTGDENGGQGGEDEHRRTPSPRMDTAEEDGPEHGDESGMLSDEQQSNFQKIFLSNLSQLQQQHLQLQQSAEGALSSPGGGHSSLPDTFLASKLNSLISLSAAARANEGRRRSIDDGEDDEGEQLHHRDGSSPDREPFNGRRESEEGGRRSVSEVDSGVVHHAATPRLSLKKELLFDPDWDGEILRSGNSMPKPEDWISIAGLSFPFPPEAAAALSASGYLPQLPLLGVPTVSPFGGSGADGGGGGRPGGNVPPLRIFNPEAYCDLCNKEFCNKYFLKTHKANKHGIYEPSASSGGGGGGAGNDGGPSFASMANPFSSIHQMFQMHSAGAPSVEQLEKLGAPDTAQVAPPPPQPAPAVKSTAQQQPPPPPIRAAQSPKAAATSATTTNPIQPTVFCDICFKKFSSLSAMRKHRSKAHEVTPGQGQSQLQQQLQQQHHHHQQQQQHLQQQLQQHLQQQHQHYLAQVHQGDEGPKDSLDSAMGCGLPDTRGGGSPLQLPDGFREDYLVEQEDASFTPQPRKLSPHSMQAARDANFAADKLRRLGVTNPEAFCEICCKEYCNKYFLRTHKLKRHGVLPTPDELKEERGPPAPWLAPFLQTSPLNLIMGGGGSVASDMVSAQLALQPSALKKFMAAVAERDGDEGAPKGTLEIKQELQLLSAKDESGEEKLPGGGKPTVDNGSDEDAEAISVDLQKLQSMIMQLNDLNHQHQQQQQHLGRKHLAGCGVCGKELANPYLLHAHMIQEHGPLGENNNNNQGLGKVGSREPTPLTAGPLTPSGELLGAEGHKQLLAEVHGPSAAPPPVSSATTAPPPQPTGGLPSPKREGFVTPDRPTTGGQVGPPPAPGYAERKPPFSLTPTSSYCEICNKELCNKYFMKTHMQRMHGIEIENGAQIGGVVCNICNKELCSKYFLRVHKHNTHGIVEEGSPLPQARQNGAAGTASGGAGGSSDAGGVAENPAEPGTGTYVPPGDPTTAAAAAAAALLKPGEISDLSNRYYSHFTEVCPLCSRRFRSAKWLRAHLLSDHGKVGVDKLKELEAKLANGGPTVGGNGVAPTGNGGGRSKSSSPAPLKVPNGLGEPPKYGQGKAPFGALSPAEAAKFLPKAAAAAAAAAAAGGIPSLFGSEQGPSPMGGLKGYQCSYCSFATPLLPLLFIHERSHSSLTIVQQQLLHQHQHHQQQQQQQQQQEEAGGAFPSLLKSESAVSLAKESSPHQTLPGITSASSSSSSVGSSSETPSSTPASTPVPSLSQEALNLQQQQHQQPPPPPPHRTGSPVVRPHSGYGLRASPPGSDARPTKDASPRTTPGGAGGEPNALLAEMANITQRPAVYALPQQSGPLMMQSFLIEESLSGGGGRGSPGDPSVGGATSAAAADAAAGDGHDPTDHRFVPAVVFLPVKERILAPMTISFNLSPA